MVLFKLQSWRLGGLISMIKELQNGVDALTEEHHRLRHTTSGMLEDMGIRVKQIKRHYDREEVVS